MSKYWIIRLVVNPMDHKTAGIDPSTGIPLTPSFHGVDCLGNGEHPGLECCCDECDFYLECFPDWDLGHELD